MAIFFTFVMFTTNVSFETLFVNSCAIIAYVNIDYGHRPAPTYPNEFWYDSFDDEVMKKVISITRNDTLFQLLQYIGTGLNDTALFTKDELPYFVYDYAFEFINFDGTHDTLYASYGLKFWRLSDQYFISHDSIRRAGLVTALRGG